MKLPVYLDNMATTPVDPKVFAKMQPYFLPDGYFGNAASKTHSYGWQAADAVAKARQQVADLIHANAEDIIWTSGATESDNLAIKGAAWFYQRQGKHLITAETEHKAVLDCFYFLQSQGFEVTYLKPNSAGLIDPAQFRAAIRSDTILASIMQVNNETGVIQDIAAFGAIAEEHGILLHVDAAQSIGKSLVDVKQWRAAMVSFSAHKVYGPKGIGALYLRPKTQLVPLHHGGNHERGFRSGTSPTALIVGMGEAFNQVKQNFSEEILRIRHLSTQLWQTLQKALPFVELNGDTEKRVPHNLNISFLGVLADELLSVLTQDVAASRASACSSAILEPSHVLKSMQLSQERLQSAVRFSFGRFNTAEEINYAAEKIIAAVNYLRNK